MWYSRKYDNAPMPNAVFINGGVAVHATQHVSRLGSAGVARLHSFGARQRKDVLQFSSASRFENDPRVDLWHAEMARSSDGQPQRTATALRRAAERQLLVLELEDVSAKLGL